MANVKPKKSLGQHFLTDMSVAQRIAATIDDCPNLPVVEVGPGTGVLTQYLLAAGRDLTVVELDSESVVYLRQGHVNEPERIPQDIYDKRNTGCGSI